MCRIRAAVTRTLLLVFAAAACWPPAGAGPAARASGFVVATAPIGTPWVAGSLPRLTPAGLDPGDIVVTASDVKGGAITHSAWFGGSGRETVHDIAVDAGGNVWVAGTTDSSDFPDRATGGEGERSFVLKLSTDGRRILASWATTASDDANSLAWLPGGGAVVAGSNVTVLDSDASVVARHSLPVGSGYDVMAAGDEGFLVGGGSVLSGGFVMRFGPARNDPEWLAPPGTLGVGRVTQLGRTMDGSVLALGEHGTLLRIDEATKIAEGAGERDVTDPRLRLLSGRRAVVGLGDAVIDDAAAIAGDALWIVGETFDPPPDGALQVGVRPSGARVFLIRDPAAPEATCPATFNFDNSAGSGQWDTPANWDTDTVPAGGDDVCIDGFAVTVSTGSQAARTLSAGATGSLTINGGSLTIAQAAVFNALTMSLGSIGGAAIVTIDGLFTWSNGSFGGAGTVTANGGVMLSGSPTLDGRRLINPAGQTITFASSSALNFSNGAVLQNDGLLDSQADNSLQWNGVGALGALENNGTYRKSGGAGASNLLVTVSNSGTMEALTGTMRWHEDFTSTGVVTAAPGARIQLSSGIHSLNPAPTIAAGATLLLDGAFVTFGSGFNPAGKTELTNSSLTLEGAPNVLATFTHSAGTLTGPSDITIAGAWAWSNGIISQTAADTTITAASGLTLSNSPTLDGRRLINPTGRTVTFSSSSAFNFSDGAVLQNDGTFDSRADNTLQWTGAGELGVLENRGLYKKSVGTGTSSLSVTVLNSGTMNAQTGKVRWQRDFTSTGPVTAAPGATLQLSGGTHTLNPSPSIPAGATLLLDGAFATFGSKFTPAGTTQLTSAALTLNGSPNVLTGLSHSGGMLTGPTDIVVTGAWLWTNGTISQTAAGRTITAASGVAVANSPTLDGRRLINPEGQSVTYLSYDAGLGFSNGAVLQNEGLFDSQADNDLQWTGIGAVGVFENNGKYEKTDGIGVSRLAVTVVNSGTIVAQLGTIQFLGDLTSTGSVTAVSGATIQMTSGMHELNPAPMIPVGAAIILDGAFATFGSGFNPAGTTQLTGASLTLNGSPNVFRGFAQSGGTLTGTTNITVNGPWTWSGGTLSQSAEGTTATISGPFTQSGAVTLDGRKLINPEGRTLAVTGAGSISFSNGAVLENAGTLDFQAGDGLSWSGTGAVGVLSNLGLVTKSTGAPVSELDVDVANQGTIDVSAGTLRFQREFTQSEGILRLGGGRVESGSSFVLEGGTIAGSGTLQADVVQTGGSLAPGFSPGTLAIAGSYTQRGSGSYNVELGGLAAGTQHDRLDVTPSPGHASLDGPLNVSLINGFIPAPGNSFTIMSYASHDGTFSGINAPDLGPSLAWSVAYNPTSAVLSVGPLAHPDLALTAVDAPDPVTEGHDLTYTWTITNSGTAAATTTTFSSPLASGVAFKSATASVGSCSQVSGIVACDIGDLAAGASATVTIVVTPGAGAVPSIATTGTVATTAADPVPDNDVATAETTVTPAETGACSSLQDLLHEVETAGSLPLQRTVRAALAAQRAGHRAVALQRLAIFVKHVRADVARGALDPEFANGLLSCAQGLRQQLVAGAGRPGAARR